MAYTAVLDANVLYGIEVTDFFLTLAAKQRMFIPIWSEEVLDEVRRNVIEKAGLSEAAIDSRIDAMNRALPGALMEVPDGLADAMTNDSGDRHVLALAVHAGAPTIVTNNLKHFSADACTPHNVEAVSADAFAVAQVGLKPIEVMRSMHEIAKRRTKPPMTVIDVKELLSSELPKAMALLQAYIDWADGTGPKP